MQKNYDAHLLYINSINAALTTFNKKLFTVWYNVQSLFDNLYDKYDKKIVI